ncbi:MAG: DUF3488 and transglutaminase-like domain-containing protein [Deltaproteobacteria bacterium]|nr:DUF3488 and transglutaminase-like domain-containing protein [Deltaproteobacteria bacterium]
MQAASRINTVTISVVASGFFALALIEEFGAVFLSIVGALTAACLFPAVRRKIELPAALWNVLAVALFFVAIADYLTVSGSLVASASHMTSVLIVFKLLDLKRGRDYMLLYLLVFLELLVAATSTASPLFFLLLLSYVITATWAMTIFSMKRDAEEYTKKEFAPPRSLFGASFAALTIAVTAFSIITTLILFFSIPRMAIGLFEFKTLNALQVVGFSDSVTMGALGDVKLDGTVVMRVRYPNAKPEGNAYFRGAVLDSFDGSTWTRTPQKKYFARTAAGGIFTSGQKMAGRHVQQEILLEPIDTEVIFALEGWSMLNGKFRNLLTDDTGALYLGYTPYTKLEYTAWSVVPTIATEKLRGTIPPLPKEELSSYMQLPDITEIGKIKALTAEVTKGLKTDEEKARAIETHLKTNYAYTLTPKKTEGISAIDNFLFYSKQGYCEHYASAMALMLRTIGIPSRIVTGFVNGEYNDVAGYYMVRQRDAHSWVEAYTKNKGWTRFEPTAPGGFEYESGSSRFGMYIDSFAWQWNRYVINYAITDQIKVGLAIEGTSHSVRSKLKAFLSNLAKSGRVTTPRAIGIALIAILAVLSAILIAVYAIRRARRNKTCRKTPAFYTDMLRILAKRGFERMKHETPLEFSARIKDSAVDELTKMFMRIRYGNEALDGTSNIQARKLLERLEEAK